MTKSVVNAFYYLNSENYGKINVNHRLSLLLNIADGFIINTFKETNNVKSSYDRLFKKTVDNQKLQQGISLLGIQCDKYKVLLTEERHTFDHYIEQENMDYAFDAIIDWIVYENDLAVDCKTPQYQMKQKQRRMGITMK